VYNQHWESEGLSIWRSELPCSEIVCFRLLSILKDLQPPKDIILFPAPVNDWPPWKRNTKYSDIRTAVVETTIQGAAEW
jgi:hypothetical protein